MNLYDLSHPNKKKKPKLISEGAPIATTPGSVEPGGAVDNFKQQMANNTEVAYQKKQQGMTEGDTVVKHRIGLTVTDPNHPMVSKRDEPFQRTVRVPGADAAKAINAAIAHYRRKGYKVHDHHYMGTVDYTVNEFAIDGGGGNNGHWYTDGEIGDRVGDAWFEEFDVSNDMFNIDARGEKAKQALVNYANQWFDNKGYNVNVVGVETNEEDHDLKWYIVGSLDEPQVDEALTMKHQRDHDTQRRPDISNSLADRDFDMSEVPNVSKSFDGHPTVKWRHHGHAGHTRVEPTLNPTSVQRKDPRPIPSFLKKGVAEAIPLDTLRSTAGTRVKDEVSAKLKQNGPLGRDAEKAKQNGKPVKPGVAEGGYQHGFADPNAPSLGGSRRKDDEGNSEFDDRQRRQTGMIFYKVDDAELAQQLGLKQTRSGKWYLRTGNRHAQQSADRAFGLGRIWYPESTVDEAGVFGFMTPTPTVKPKPKFSLSQIRDLSKQDDEKVAKYVRSNDLPKNPDHMRVVHDDVELGELSNELLGRYKKELGVRASAADRAGDYDRGHEYFKKINRATIRQGDNDARRHAEKENDMMETRLNMMRKAGYDL